MRRKRSFYVILCISIICLISGCRQVPDSVKEKARKHQKAEDVEETDIKYVSIDHILDNQKEVLGKTYQNLEFQETVHLEQPDSISVLSMTITNPFTTKDKFADLCAAFFGTDKYRNELTRMENLPEWPDGQGLFAFNHNHPDDEDAAYVADSGYLVCYKKNAKFSTENRQTICHVDWNENMDIFYEVGGEKISIREAVDYVNDWCNKYWAILEPEYRYQVKTIYVCMADNKEYYYYFEVCKFYKGMPFDDITFSDSADDYYYYKTNSLNVVMEHKNELSFFQNSENSYDIVKEKTYNDKLIGLEQAVLLVQEKMSGGQKFEITDIDLKYVTRSDMSSEEVVEKDTSFNAPGSPFTARPTWSFILDYQPSEEEEESDPWPRKFINVDMISGEILYRDSI